MRIPALVLVVLSLAAVIVLTVPPADRPPVVLVTVETVRADHVGPCYGYDRETAPNLCTLAHDGVLFENAYAAGTATRVSVPSLLTGRPPNSVAHPSWGTVLSDNVTTVGEHLDAAGYHSIAHARPGHNWMQGFDVRQWHERSSFYTMDVQDGSFFFWSFIQEQAHDPYTPDERYRRWDNTSLSARELRQYNDIDGLESLARRIGVDEMTALYDAEIREADATIGQIMERLREQGRYREALIIVTSDHGEWFNDTGRDRFDHGGKPREPVARVPLVVKFPGNRWAGTRITEPVGHLNVPPTVYDVVGRPNPDGVRGASLGSVVRGADAVPVTTASPSDAPPLEWWMTRDGPYKYYVPRVDEACADGAVGASGSLYDLAAVPREQVRITADRPAVAERLEADLCSWYRYGERFKVAAPERNMSASLRQRLERLGYLR